MKRACAQTLFSNSVIFLLSIFILASHQECKQSPHRTTSNYQTGLTPELSSQPVTGLPSTSIDSVSIAQSLPWLIDTIGVGWREATVLDFKSSRDQKFVAVNLSNHASGSAYRFLIYSPTEKRIFYPGLDDLRTQGLGYPCVRYAFDTLSSLAVVIVGYRSLMARIVSLPDGRVTWEEELPDQIDENQLDSILSGWLGKH